MVKKVITRIKYPVLIAGIVLCLVGIVQAATGNIDATDKWAWGTNAGWINFRPEHGGVTVYGDHLEGYAWGENIGWIRLGIHTGGGAHTYGNTTNTNYGVNNDGAGNLSGYAWGTNVGWINFNPSDSQVTINTSNGSFDGYAWGENVGWIHFKNASPAYNVVTTWLDTDGDGVPDGCDNCSCNNPDQADGNGDGQGDACDPVIESITAPIDPVDINDLPIVVSGTFSDCDDGDSHTAEWDWGDETTSDGTVGQTANSVSGSHTYAEPGVYAVKLTVSDGYPASDEEIYEFVAIYDPEGGFVTGGGWIMSPEGACPDFCGGATGKANFGFVSKYKKGASEPTGQTEFQFKAGDLNFHSSSYDWLVVAGQDKAKYKGVGTINGGGNYGFMLTAKDGSPDTFRIKIWDKDAGDGMVYDNKMGAGDDSYDGTALGGGNIKVHKAK